MLEIKVNPLSLNSIETAIADLKAYKEKLKSFPAKYTRALSEYFQQTLCTEAPNLQNHWIFDVRESEGKATGIFIFEGFIQFIEFGSGYIGLINHDGINDDWLSKLPPPYNKGYNVGTYYIRNKDNPPLSYWVYNKNGKYYKTQGQPANPFIYRSVQELLDARERIAKQVMELGV